MKYIDADKLKALVKRQIRWENLNFAALGGGGQTFCTNTLEWILKQIDSLQQEEPEEVCIFKPNMTIDEMIDSLNGKQPEQQEWDLEEVDLTEEINRYCGTRDVRPVPDFMETVAYHFYELGRINTRKEE